MDGIQSRVLKAINGRGSYGVFDEDHCEKSGRRDLLRRSLLWHRAADNPALVRIPFPANHHGAPSWSWMAYVGEIDFLQPRFGDIEWMEIQTPWSNGVKSLAAQIDEPGRGGVVQGVNAALCARVRGISDIVNKETEGMLFFDIPSEMLGNSCAQMWCVVLGVERGEHGLPLASRRHYFMLVRPSGPTSGVASELYERAGVGYLPGRCLSAEGHRIWIH